jgi:cell wall-associated NlpC family hydrolase
MRNKAMFIVLFVGAGLAGCATAPQAPGPAAPPPAPRAAESLGGPTEARDAAIFALSLVGTRYAAGGASPDTGFDCSGLVAYVYDRAAQIRLPRNTFDLARAGIPIAQSDLVVGDLVFYNTQRRPFSHVGIYLGESRFVHAPSTGGFVRIEQMDLRYWAQRFDGARRLNF